MQMSVCGGQDDLAVRAHVHQLLEQAVAATGAGVEKIDLEEDGARLLLDAVGTPSMFNPVRVLHVRGVELLEAPEAVELASLAAGSDAIVIARGKLKADTRRALGALADVHEHKTDKPAVRVRQIAQSYGLKLTPASLHLIAERAGEDLPRVDSLCAHLAAVGLLTPDADQVLTLLGSSSAADVPWDLSDALENGRLGQALTLAERAEPYGALGYLLNRMVQLGAAAELLEQRADKAQIMSELSIKNEFAAGKLIAAARKLGPERAGQALHLCLQGSVQARQGHISAGQALLATVSALAVVLAPS